MKTQFKKFGWIYLPVHVLGILITAALAFHMLLIAKAVDHHSHSVTDTLYGLFPYVVCTFFCYEWIAKKMSHGQ